MPNGQTAAQILATANDSGQNNNPDLISAYQKAGGTLSNGIIPKMTDAPIMPKISVNPLGIVGSADVSKANATSAAREAAANSMNGVPPPTPPTPPPTPMTAKEQADADVAKQLADAQTAKIAQDSGAEATAAAQKTATDLAFNADLAASNAQYNDLRTTLNNQYKTDIAYALEAVTDANPYGAVKGGNQTLKNYQDTITAKYNTQALLIEQKASAAAAQLRAGQYEAYAKTQKELSDAKASFAKDLMTLKLNLSNSAKQAAQFQQGEQDKATDDYRTYLTSVPYTPTEVKSMTDEQILNTTAGRLGAKAGLTPAMIRQDMSEGSFKSQQIEQTAINQASLAENRDRMFALALEKFASSNDKNAPVEFNVDAEGLGGSFNRAFSEATTQGYSNDEVKRIKANASAYAKNGDVEGLKENLLMVATKSLGTAEQTKIRGRQAGIDALDNIQKALDDYKNSGGETNLVTGTLEQVAQKIGTTSNAKLAKIKNLIATAQSDYRLTQTGVAFNKEEAKQYKDIYPDISNIGGLNIAKIDSTKEAMKVYLKSTLGSLIGKKNYDEIYSNASSGSGSSYAGIHLPN